LVSQTVQNSLTWTKSDSYAIKVLVSPLNNCTFRHIRVWPREVADGKEVAGNAVTKRLATTPISVLDLAPYPQGKSVADAYHASRDLAQHVERLGYKRFWIAEHHNIEGIASAATSVLIGYVAENTRSIRVGSGGIMLPNHAPMVIAEQFGTLSALYPGRIDLGLGRAPGSDRMTMQAIRRTNSLKESDFGELIEELELFLSPVEPGQRLRAIPGAGAELDLWILGSSLYSAHLAARLGKPYAFAGHFAPAAMLDAFRVYRSEFQPSSALRKPKVMVGVPVIAAESDEAAERLATTAYQTFLGLVRNARTQAPPPVESMDGLWSPQEKAAVMSMLEISVIGGPAKVKAGLQALIDQTGADELIVSSHFYDYNDRLRSYEVIANVAEHKLIETGALQP
jgi:luciferase family oxidoreductase group 1